MASGVMESGDAGRLIPAGAALEQLYSGMGWSEGPTYFPALDTLVFSDIPGNRLLQWTPGLGVRTLVDNSNYTNGSTRDHAGRRISCEHLTNAVVRIEGDGTRTMLASRYAGGRLNSPNDVVVRGDGTIWFTDPTYGIMIEALGRVRQSEQEGCYVFRIDPATGTCSAVCETLRMPNGLAFSIDEKTLYVADSSRSHFSDGLHHVFAFDVAEDGTLGEQRVFHEVADGVPDGIRIDDRGNLWCSGASGVEVVDPSGVVIARIPVPETVANLTFGGQAQPRLFITATTSLYAIDVAVRDAEAARGR